MLQKTMSAWVGLEVIKPPSDFYLYQAAQCDSVNKSQWESFYYVCLFVPKNCALKVSVQFQMTELLFYDAQAEDTVDS